jgi:AraC family transcriptional regulator of arabinose operon
MIFNSYAEKKEALAGIRLISCGQIFAEPKREINRPTGRDDWLLFYVAKESETFFIDKAVTAEAGSFILFAPGEKQHHVYNGSSTAEFFYVHFQCDALPDGIALETSHVYSLPYRKQLASVFEEIIEETLSKRPSYEILCISRLLYLFSLIQREAVEANSSANKGWHGIERAIQHMNRYCDQNLKLEDYASMCHMSKYHFLRVFKEVTGATPLEYRSRIRIDHAKELLKNSNFSVSEISESLGYSSLAYFSAAFKKATGMSPTEFCIL